MTLRVGLVINPIAGLGGEAGFKGSDGHWQDALSQGFEPHAADRAKRLVDATASIEWHHAPGALGLGDEPGKALGETSAADTQEAIQALAPAVDLICFVGGDGTATDVAKVAGDTPCLGIPAGVKITSAVFAHDVEEAAWLLENLDPGFETVARDVTDLDEAAYRSGRVDVTLTGTLRVPLSPAVQGGKVATVQETPLEPLVEQVMADWDPDAAYLVGAGSVCRAIKQQFWGEPTLLGIDAIAGGRIVEMDLNGPAVLAFVQAQQALGRPVRILLSTIGGQGMLLGRGTHPLHEALGLLGWDALWVVAPPEKLVGLRGLHVDVEPSLSAGAPAYMRVTSGLRETRMLRLLAGHEAND